MTEVIPSKKIVRRLSVVSQTKVLPASFHIKYFIVSADSSRVLYNPSLDECYYKYPVNRLNLIKQSKGTHAEKRDSCRI